MFAFSGVSAADGQEFPILGDQRLTVAGLMAPDLNPADRAINISEVTAYGAAWRRGESWPIAPNPIPMDYVTRAAALWRWGECYTVNGGVAVEPLFWVSCTSNTPPEEPRPVFPQANCAERQLPAGFVPGEACKVVLVTHPATGVAGWAVTERVPAGWMAAEISNGGEFDGVCGEVRWGPFLDDLSHALTYQALPPPTTAGAVRFTGSASFDGVSAGTTGANSVAEACRLEISAAGVPSQLTITLSGRLDARFQVETSTDLHSWVPLTVLTNTTGRVRFLDPNTQDCQQRFYRARLVP
jgi:hypothetical protein